MIASEIIRRKRDGVELSKEEIEYMVQGYVSGEIADYQVSAWCMAVYFMGMSEREIRDLVRAIAYSGKTLDLSEFSSHKIDKHSTGGVGDKVSIVLVPLMASCDFLFPKLAGRGLGYTGGTIDKIESIPGFRTELTLDEIRNILKKTNAVIGAQTEELAPADKKIYLLRDVTATVESIPLIVSSILGKKLAIGTDVWVFDVKVGKGAFMKDINRARELARLLVAISKELNKKACALITDMNQPLGRSIGNSLEIEEAIKTLKGNGPEDLTELVLSLGVELSFLAGNPISKESLYEKLRRGEALERFIRIVEAQGGDPRIVENPKLMPYAPYRFALESDRDGLIASIDAEKIGLAVLALGGGRRRKEDDIDRGVGIKLLKKEGESVRKGEPLVEILYRCSNTLEEALHYLRSAYEIGDVSKAQGHLIYEKVL